MVDKKSIASHKNSKSSSEAFRNFYEKRNRQSTVNTGLNSDQTTTSSVRGRNSSQNRGLKSNRRNFESSNTTDYHGSNSTRRKFNNQKTIQAFERDSYTPHDEVDLNDSDNNCIICRDEIKQYAIPECDHTVCMKCSIK